MNEDIVKLQGEVVELTRIMKEKADKGYSAEVQALSDKVTELTKQLTERKHMFEVDSKVSLERKELETRSDELFIAAAILRKEDGTLDKTAYEKVTSGNRYADVIKSSTSGFSIAVDPNSATASGFGKDYVPTQFSQLLYEEIWLDLQVAALFKRINMPSPTFVLPFSPGRMYARATGESAAPTKTKATTSNITFNAQKIMSNVEFTDEFEADSIIAVLPFIRQQLIGGFATALETMCINGDKGTVTTTAAYAGDDPRQLVNGIRTDAYSSGALGDFTTGGYTADNLRTLRTAMGKYGKKPDSLAIVVTMNDYNKMLASTWNSGAFQALYSYGSGATLLTGEMGRFDNIPIIVSELLPTAGYATDSPVTPAGLNAVGKYDNTTKTGTNCIMVNTDAYMWGDRATFLLETYRNPFNQTFNLIGSQRVDFEKVLTSTDKTAAVGYKYLG